MTPTKEQVCSCGKVHDANEIALKLAEDMLKNDCTMWAMQVMSAFVALQRPLAAGMTLRPLDDDGMDEFIESFNQLAEANIGASDEHMKRISKMMSATAVKSFLAGVEDKGLAKSLFEASEKLAKKR